MLQSTTKPHNKMGSYEHAQGLWLAFRFFVFFSVAAVGFAGSASESGDAVRNEMSTTCEQLTVHGSHHVQSESESESELESDAASVAFLCTMSMPVA